MFGYSFNWHCIDNFCLLKIKSDNRFWQELDLLTYNDGCRQQYFQSIQPYRYM